jgi:hypothetical protein
MHNFRKTSSLIISLLSLAATTLTVNSASAACNAATVTAVSQNNGQCGGKVGFITNVSGFIVCTTSEFQGSLVMSAYLSGRPIKYQLGSGDTDCNPDANESVPKAAVWIQAV